MNGSKLNPDSIAIFRALQLGDMLCAVPAFRALRAEFPRAKIVLVGLPWAAEFVRRFNHYLDELVEFPGYPGLPGRTPRIHEIPEFFKKLQKREFSLAIQMHGDGTIVNGLMSSWGAVTSAGYYLKGHPCPDPDYFTEYPERGHEIERNLQLLQYIGIRSRGTELEFPLTPTDGRELADIPEASRLKPGSYACVHPGARKQSRRWPEQRFAEVGDSLSALGLQVVLTGSRDETALAQRVGAAMKSRHVNLAGKTTLGALGELVSKARLIVCNDTGISHLAAALRVPSVVIANGSDPERRSPLDKRLHRALFHPIDCRPCAHERCPIGHPCALNVSVQAVVREAGRLLEKGNADTPAAKSADSEFVKT